MDLTDGEYICSVDLHWTRLTRSNFFADKSKPQIPLPTYLWEDVKKEKIKVSNFMVTLNF